MTEQIKEKGSSYSMMPPDYNYSIAQCDVPPERRSQLEAYRAKRQQWLTWLDADEHHPLWTSLSSMVWTDVSYRTLRQTVIDHEVKNEATCLQNTLIAEQIIQGYVARQVLGIRRLLDKTSGVISLRRLIIDLRSHWQLFTRENYICHDGLPYDFEAVMTREMTARAGKGAFWASTTGPDAWAMSRMAHEQFDRLAGIDPDKRTRGDRLPKTLLGTIEGWLDGSGAEELADWSHAYLAHAGGPDRRRQIEEDLVTADKISEATRTLVRVTEAVSAYVLFAGGRVNGLVPVAQYDQFEHLDQPAVQPGHQGNAAHSWDALSRERDTYAANVEDDLIVHAKKAAA
jgi:hypothetical protein